MFGDCLLSQRESFGLIWCERISGMFGVSNTDKSYKGHFCCGVDIVVDESVNVRAQGHKQQFGCSEL